MKKLKSKRYTISLLVTVLGLIGLISGTSYAILKGSTNATDEQLIKTGSVELKITENFHGIDEGIFALTDIKGLMQDDVYSFTVTNIGTVSAKYDLKLVNEAPNGQTALSDTYIRLGLEVNGQEMGPMGLSKVNNVIDSNTIETGEIIRYKLRIWFDSSKVSELTGNTNKAYLKLKVEAKQAEYKEYEPEPGATVLYTDGTLIINEPTSKRQANITAHGAVSKEYTEMKSEGTDLEKYVFTSATDQPWNADAASITKVEIGQQIRPTSTAYWCSGLTAMESGDFIKLNTSKVTDMSYMFQNAGNSSGVTSFTLTGLEDWNTARVTNMTNLFNGTGYYATTLNIGDISDWNTSSVTNMSSMFRTFGYNAEVINLNLSNWDTSNVTNMSSMFRAAGYSTSVSWSVGDLSGWDTSKVTDMNYMFANACRDITVCSIGDLSNWNTSHVTDMSYMFRVFAAHAATLNIGNLANWDVSSVTNMSGMFMQLGQYSTTWNIGTLSNWNTSQVTDMSGIFQNAGASATTWNSIGTLKVYATNISNMFLGCANAKATLNLYVNPTTYTSAFSNAATASGALITVNYKSSVINANSINNIIATKSSNSNVVKGSVIS